MELNESIARKVLTTVDAGLVSGLGAEILKPAERHITSTALAMKLTMILDRSKRIAGESITSGAAAVLSAYTGALRTEFEHLLDDLENGE